MIRLELNRLKNLRKKINGEITNVGNKWGQGEGIEAFLVPIIFRDGTNTFYLQLVDGWAFCLVGKHKPIGDKPGDVLVLQKGSWDGRYSVQCVTGFVLKAWGLDSMELFPPKYRGAAVYTPYKAYITALMDKVVMFNRLQETYHSTPWIGTSGYKESLETLIRELRKDIHDLCNQHPYKPGRIPN